VTVRIGQLDVHVAPPGLVCNPEPFPVYHDTTDDENDFPETKHEMPSKSNLEAMSVTWIPECRHAFVSDVDMPLTQRFKVGAYQGSHSHPCVLLLTRRAYTVASSWIAIPTARHKVMDQHVSDLIVPADTCTHSKRHSAKYADGSRRCWECLVLYHA